LRDEDLPLFDVPRPEPGAPTVIHPSAVIEPGAQIGQGVHVGPYCVVGPKVQLHDGVRLESHVTVGGRTTVGARTVIYPFATIGVIPQDLKYAGEDAELIIGEENSIRQYVNMSIGTAGGGGRTVIGRRSLFMVYVHIGHDSHVGDNVVFANGVSLGGHVIIESRAFIGGHAAVHQFCRVGSRAMVGGGSMVTQDVPPFTTAQGDRARPTGLNLVGLKRAGYSNDELRDIKSMYRLLYNENLTVEDAIARMESEIPASPSRANFVAFLRASERGVVR
jgi:UDP-N-acetylglucosamine acyltransferase